MLELASGCFKEQHEAVCEGTKLEIGWKRSVSSLAVWSFHIEPSTSIPYQPNEFHVPALKEKQARCRHTASAVVTCSLVIWNAAIYSTRVARYSIMV
jgi:hypothetical protein